MMKNISLILAILFITIGCKNDDDTNDVAPEVPTDFALIFPFENSECNEGTNITDTESTVLFEWETSQNADGYELVIRDLNSNQEGSVMATDTRVPIVLQRATPYSWYVIARSDEADSVTQSATWKFYNAGDGIEAYAPFPAEIVFPAMSQTISAPSGTITLDWNSQDVDNDIESHDIYFGTTNPPELFAQSVSNSEFTNVSVSANTIYYWKVITIDSRGNQSDSGIFQFEVE